MIKYSPGNCCCDKPCDGPCVLFSDKFDRINSGTIGTGWTEDAGAWEIKDQNLYTEASNAKASYDPDPFGTYGDVDILVSRLKGRDDGDELILWYADILYFKFTLGAGGKIQIFDDTDLLLYERPYDLPVDQYFVFKYIPTLENPYFGDNRQMALMQIDGTNVLSFYTQHGKISTLSCATGTITRSAHFDFVCLLKSNDAQAGCEGGLWFPWDLETRYPNTRTFTAVIAGAINNGTTDYTALNGTYVLTQASGWRINFSTYFDPTINFPFGGYRYPGPDPWGVESISFSPYGYTQGAHHFSPYLYFEDPIIGNGLINYRQTFGNSATPPATSDWTLNPPTQTGFHTNTITLICDTPDAGTCTVSY